ncbi:beta strand repeat-containing protein [Sphingomonas sp. 3-13AW]|uniref:beta strand repeat-containing protein n=1 Tax=Sphingomonas sp. 3-13AW TaxID=3050450 RepID=UPI003BB61DF8
MPTLYIAPTGSGSGDGSSAANAATLGDLPRLIAAAGPGGEVLLIADQGAYTAPAQALSIVAGGTDGAPVTIRGVDSAGNAMAATIVGTRPESFDPANPSGEEVFRMLDGADHLRFSDLAFQNVGIPFRVGADIENLTIEHVDARNVARFFDDIASGTNTSASIAGLTIRDVEVAGYSKGAIRVQYDSSNVLIQDVRGDSQFQDGDNFAIGVHITGTAHDVVIDRVAMRNALDTVNAYRNGDGFATERGTYNVTLRNVIATGNSDGGLDLKSDNVVVDRAIVSGNGRNIRIWGTGAQLSNIVSLDAGAPLAGGNREHVWLAEGAAATVRNALFSDPGSPLLFNLSERNGKLVVADLAMVNGAGTIVSKRGTGSTLTLSGERGAVAAGTAGDDLLVATVGADIMAGGAGRDILVGGAGGDALYGEAGDDMLVGDAGDDLIEGGAGADIMVGGAGRDLLSYAGSLAAVRIDLLRLTGSGGDAEGDLFDGFEDLQGSAFADSLSGDAGANRLSGGDGDDALAGRDGDDVLIGGAGADSLDGGSGFDRADYSESMAAVTVDLATGSAGGGDAAGDRLVNIEAVSGSIFSDFLGGSESSDRLDGAAGDDRIEGRGGDDTLVGGTGADTLVGGEGTDTADYSAATGAVIVDLAEGLGFGAEAEGDRLEGIERLVGSRFDDVLTGDGSNNWLAGGAGSDLLTGGEGVDTADYSTSASAVAVTLGGWGVGGDAEGDLLSGIENVEGSAFDDVLVGDGGANALAGGTGNDRLVGNGGLDRLDGGEGTDVADYSGSAAAVTVSLASGTGSAGETLVSIENLIGSAFDDVLLGDAGDNRLTGGGGADLLDGGEGFDLADYSTSGAAVQIDLALETAANGGDAAGDRLVGIEAISGSAFDDALFGTDGANTLLGGAGADRLEGRGGDDLLQGGAGADVLIGGEGFDSVDFSANATAISINLLTGVSTGGETEGDQFEGVERFIGSGYADTIVGDAADQWLVGGAGADVLDGGAGFDTAVYESSASAVTINLGAELQSRGDAQGDRLLGIEAVVGSAFADILTGNAAANRIEGGAGNDTIDGGAGADMMIGGAGDDAYVVDDAGDAVLEAADGGLDIVRTSLASLTLADGVEDLSYTGDGAFTGIGNALANSLYGRASNDALYGMDGDDKLVGGMGADLLDGGAGRDQVDYTKSAAVTVNLATNVNLGGEAEGDRLVGIEIVVGSNYADHITGSDDPVAGDTLYGRGGNDVLNGGAGDDLLDGGAGSDIMAGGTGNDTYVVYEGGDQVVELAGEGRDRVRTANTAYVLAANVEELVYTGTVAATLTGNELDNLIVGGGGADLLTGGSGNDTLRGGASGDVLDGGAGLDTVDYTGSLGGVQVNLRYQTATGADAMGDRLISIENAKGGAFADTLLGSAGANVLSGGDGDDILSGDDGNDTLWGGSGLDRLDGGKNEDSLYGEDGDDILTGGQQTDTLQGGAGNDLLIGDTEWISSLAARDTLDGGDGDDILIGDGNSFTASGKGGNDILRGGAGDDVLIGDGRVMVAGSTGGSDTLDGGLGNDVLYGDGVSFAPGARGGSDKLTGGGGSDRFVFAPGSGSDEITDFTRGGAEADVIDLSAFAIAYEALRFTANASGLTVRLSETDSILVRGVTSLDQADFLFG